MHASNPNTSPTGASASSDRGEKTRARLWSFALIAGILAALISWGAGEAAQGWFPATLNQLPMSQQTQEASGPAMKALTTSTMIKKGAVAYGLLGGLLGLYLGLAGGLARRSKEDAIKAGVVGLVVGAVAAAAASWVLVPNYFRMVERLAEAEIADPGSGGNYMISGFMVHGGIWAAVGLAGGLALGLGEGGRGRILHAMIGGLLGALLATGIYELVGVSMFQKYETGLPVSLGLPTRMMAHMLVGVLVALGAVFASQHLNIKRPPAATSA